MFGELSAIQPGCVMRLILSIYLWWLERGLYKKFDPELSLKLDAVQQLIETYEQRR